MRKFTVESEKIPFPSEKDSLRGEKIPFPSEKIHTM